MSTPSTHRANSTEPFPPGPEPETHPDPPDPSPSDPDGPEPTQIPEETPFTEPKQYPIHPEIPVQPIHENDPTLC
jgi:hypothetical protein